MSDTVAKKDFTQGGAMAEKGGAENPEESGGGSKKKIIIIAAVVLLLIAAGAGGWFFFLRPTEEDKTAEVSPTGKKMEDTNQMADQKMINPLFSEPLEFTVNLRDGRRYLKVTMRVALNEEAALTYMNGRLPILKDLVITTLQNKTSAELRNLDGVDRLKMELLRKANAIFTEEYITESETKDPKPIKRILFEEFMLQ